MNELTRKIMANIAAGHGCSPAPRSEATAISYPDGDMNRLVNEIHSALTGERDDSPSSAAAGSGPANSVRPRDLSRLGGAKVLSLSDLAKLQK